MAQYEFFSELLAEAGGALHSIAVGLSEVREQLGGILADLPDSMHGFRQQISAECGTIEELYLYANTLGLTLLEIIEIYTRAEQTAFNEVAQNEQRTAVYNKSNTPGTPPIIHRTYGVLLSGGPVLPDWLQAAVLKYEQSTTQ